MKTRIGGAEEELICSVVEINGSKDIIWGTKTLEGDGHVCVAMGNKKRCVYIAGDRPQIKLRFK